MTNLSPRLQPLFNKTKIVCFGHFVLEAPATATIVYGPAEVEYPIVYYPGEGENVAQRVNEQLILVQKDRDYLSDDSEFLGKDSLFGKVVNGALPGQKLVFGSRDHFSYSIDSFIPLGDDLYIQHVTSAVPKDESIRILNTAAKLLRRRLDHDIPNEPGVCIDGGFVPWQPEFERASVGVRLKEFPDVHFSVEVSKNQDYLVHSSALEPLLDRAAKDGGSWYTRIKFFRRGPRQLGNWSGFEVMARKPAQENTTESHEFAFVSLGALRDTLQPELHVKLDTGVKDDQTASVKPSITDEEAVALWDKLITSIRPRPTGAAAKQNEAVPPKAPLGTFIDTGALCPQAGWWQCSDIGEVAGGRRRHFVAEESMPHAVLLGRSSTWQKLVGGRPTQLIATSWQLVAYDQLPDLPDLPDHKDDADSSPDQIVNTQVAATNTMDAKGKPPSRGG